MLLFATTNPHKLDEVRAILGPLGVEVIGLDDLDVAPSEPEEDAETFAGNARLKAMAYAAATELPCLADDSGLEVDALDGAPGVRSARFAGVDGSRAERDGANNALLLQRLADVPDDARGARFVCAMCLAVPDGRVLAETRGTFDGSIVRSPRGENGFGYDPLLEVAGDGRTSAELSSTEKNARSHRGAAARTMVDRLLTLGLLVGPTSGAAALSEEDAR